MTDPCPHCQHPLAFHYFDVTETARCLAKGAASPPWGLACECTNFGRVLPEKP